MRSEKSDAAYLQDMVESASAVVRYIAGKTRADFDADPILRDAIERRVEIIGEAARGISQPFQDHHPEIPWRNIRGTRHILAHEYGRVNPDVMWKIATTHIPEMLEQLQKLLPPLPEEPT